MSIAILGPRFGLIGGILGLGVLTTLSPSQGFTADPAKFTPEQLAFFEKEVQPLLKANCFKCHGGEAKIKGNLRLTSRAGVLKGGDLGPAVLLDKPDESNVLKAINYRDGLEMPPTGKLAQAKIDVLTKWVKMGVPWTPGADAVAEKPKREGGKVTPEAKAYWAYQPVKRLAAPAVKNAAWVTNPIDAFILARLEAKGLKPAAPADKLALVRRVYYDLTGLPPTPEEVDRFVNDPSPDAYEKLLDKLLDSPQYGEKWGRHWLDLVRFAETNGYERDGPKPNAWRFRDYVIKSFNEDKPYDRFIREQLAGDEIAHADENRGANAPRSPEDGIADAIIATGYFRLGVWDDEPVDLMEARYNEYDDIVATTSQVFLAMTMNCARCHDHKIDPIPQKDYYQMVAFFRDIQHYSPTRDVASKFNQSDITPRAKRALYEDELKAREVRVAELMKLMVELEDEAIKKMPAEDQRASEGPDRPEVLKKVPGFFTEEQKKQYNELAKERGELKRKPSPHQELALSINHCEVTPPQQHVMVRGSPHAPGAPVEPDFPEVLGFPRPTIPTPAKDAKTSGRRSVLADWIASKDNPLTARVLVNRLWQFHFGRGIVTSANDFGKFGVLPTHQELLDWLASEFMAGEPGASAPGGRGWTIKRMHKLIMMSSAYRMSSHGDDQALKADPSNQLFWRFNLRRLTAEEMRDSLLAVSGKLNLKQSGPSIHPPIPKEVLAGQSRPGEGWPTTRGEEANRRSVYVHIKRNLLVPILSQHDMADTDSSCAVRYTTTVPTQSLGMLNGEFTNEQATCFAERLRKEAPDDLAAQVRRAIRLTTGRVPREEEVSKDVAYIHGLKKHGLSDADALRHYALMALNANEFAYID